MDWQAMVFLGAYHGLNPGMGWLFAVALGMQQGRARGVWRALPPIAMGHAFAVGVVVLIAELAGRVLPIEALKILVASILMTLGLYRLWRHRHPRFGGMQVGFRDLTIWSFLMASAHGAGIMVLPFVMPSTAALAANSQEHLHHMAVVDPTMPVSDLSAVAVHTLAYFAVMTVVAWVVYRKLGLALLRRAWINTDAVWASSLVIAGVALLLK